MKNNHLENVSFDFIRYANCWEDPEVLIKALSVDENSTVISIGSGGDNCFSLLTESPKKIIAVDISESQLHLISLKIEGIKRFSREEYLQFVGIVDSDARLEMYDSIRSELGSSVSSFWDERRSDIETGIIHCGKFEKYFQLFRKEFLLSFHTQDVIDGLFRVKSAEDQGAYYKEKWYRETWAEKHAIFFGAEMLGEKGRDPEFMKLVEGSVSENILQREVAHLKSVHCQDNPFLFYILNNRFDEAHLPHYVRKENYSAVKNNIDRIDLQQGLLEKALENNPDGTHFNLSNIFEYMDDGLFKEVTDNIIAKSAPKAKFAYWNLLIDRNMSDVASEKLEYDHEKSDALSCVDKGYFYKTFNLNQKK